MENNDLKRPSNSEKSITGHTKKGINPETKWFDVKNSVNSPIFIYCSKPKQMHNVFITFDYELFFGTSTGSLSETIISPTYRVMELLSKYGIKATFFIDSGYLVRLKKAMQEFDHLKRDYTEVCNQIKAISSDGHDIQLHIHPHWEDSYYDGENWKIITDHYRLHNFTESKINEIISSYKKVLTELTFKNVFAYRAGGWCIQPFEYLYKSLAENNIWLDSTVFFGGSRNTPTHYFDFKNAPKKHYWRFQNDPVVEETNGYFHEIPIASIRVSPLFFWLMVIIRIIGGENHRPMGNGETSKGSVKEYFKMLIFPSYTVVSVDGYKAKLLDRAFMEFVSDYPDHENFVIIGHPKSMTEFSFCMLEEFLKRNSGKHQFLIFSDWAERNINGSS